MVFKSLVRVELGSQLATWKSQFAGFTLVAMAAVWLWALPPMTTPLLYVCPHNWSDADLVRHLWHLRLVEPEWVADPPRYDYLRWAQDETLARLSLVFLGWLTGSTWLFRRNPAGRQAKSPFWLAMEGHCFPLALAGMEPQLK
jgi:hypothetical protein